MNLADYLSELLGQQDEVSVPGLGCFVRTRVNAFYNEREAKFYPPYYQVKFTPNPKDDDTFAQYVANKKNISLASSKYFSEKFITKLKEDATKGKYLFADLGLFYTDQDQLVFKPNDKIASDPAFYGYPEINIDKLGQPPVGEYTRPSLPKSVSTPTVVVAPAQTIPEPEYFEEETEQKRGMNVWLIVLIALAVVAVAGFGVYKFYPQAFDKMGAAFHNITGKTKKTVAPATHEAKTDTAKQAVPVKDSMAKVAAPVVTVVDTAKLLHFEVIAGRKFGKWQKATVDAEVERLKALGLPAKISTDAPGILLKITVGTYFTQHEADSVRLALINSGKISKNSVQPLKINPKQ